METDVVIDFIHISKSLDIRPKQSLQVVRKKNKKIRPLNFCKINTLEPLEKMEGADKLKGQKRIQDKKNEYFCAWKNDRED